jgi:hypothetical protein
VDECKPLKRGGGATNTAAGALAKTSSSTVAERAKVHGLIMQTDVVEDVVAAAEGRILVETGVGSAAEVAHRMCGGHEETALELQHDIAERERRIRALERDTRESELARDHACMVYDGAWAAEAGAGHDPAAAARSAVAVAESANEAGPASCCLPRHPAFLEQSIL